MAKILCHECKKEIMGGAKIQEFDPKEATSMKVFCSESCRENWLATINNKQ